MENALRKLSIAGKEAAPGSWIRTPALLLPGQI